MLELELRERASELSSQEDATDSRRLTNFSSSFDLLIPLFVQNRFLIDSSYGILTPATLH